MRQSNEKDEGEDSGNYRIITILPYFYECVKWQSSPQAKTGKSRVSFPKQNPPKTDGFC